MQQQRTDVKKTEAKKKGATKKKRGTANKKTAKVRAAATKSGDSNRLSPTDMTVIALAIDLNGTIWTDDYSIQNVASILGIPYRAVGMAGIKKVVKWNYQCMGCKKWYKEKQPDCPICGSQMKACRRK